MKKKLFSVLLVSTLAISLLAGCNNKSDKETVDKVQTEATEATEVATEKTVSADGITVTGFMGDAEEVEMSALTDGDDYKTATDFVATLTDKTITATEVYNIDLLDKNSKKVQPEKSVNISLTLSDNMVNAEGDGYEVYRREDDNTFTDLSAAVNDKEVSFETEQFSIYVVVKTNSAPVEETTEAASEETEPAADTQSPYSYTDQSATMYAQRNVNVRDLPDTNGNKVGGLSTNQEVTVTGQCNETGWYRIAYNGGTAYVSNSYLGNSKVETTSTNSSSQSSSNTGNSSNGGSTQATTPSNDNGGGNSDAGSNSTASEELPSNPYPLNTLVEDTGSSISFYILTERGAAALPIEMIKTADLYIMNMGKTPIMTDESNGIFCGNYKEGAVWKYTMYY